MSIIRTAKESELKNECTGNPLLVGALSALAGNQEKPCRPSLIHSWQRVQSLNYFVFSQNQTSLHTSPLLPLPPDSSSRFPASFLKGWDVFGGGRQCSASCFQPAHLLRAGRQQQTPNCSLFPGAKSWKDAFVPVIDTEFRHSTHG